MQSTSEQTFYLNNAYITHIKQDEDEVLAEAEKGDNAMG